MKRGQYSIPTTQTSTTHGEKHKRTQIISSHIDTVHATVKYQDMGRKNTSINKSCYTTGLVYENK